MGGAASSLKDRCALVGTGETEYSYRSDRPVVALEIEACLKAIDDAGLKARDIDGIITVGARPSQPLPSEMAHYLGIRDLSFAPQMSLGGASVCAAVGYAAMAVDAGIANNVLCFYGSGSLGGSRRDRASVAADSIIRPAISSLVNREFEAPFGFVNANCIAAMEARRYMHETGATTSQFGMVAVIMRKHAMLNDNALARTPITLDDHQNSRMIVNPLRLLDITQHADGAVALVVSSAESAKALRQPPVYIMGFAEGHGPMPMDTVSRLNIMEYGVKYAAAKVFEMASVIHKDIDVVEMFEPYTFHLLRYLEDLGFCKYGEAGFFVEEGRIELGRDLPVNTNGGHLAGAWIEGWNQVLEAVRQLRGHAGPAQVKDARIALAASWGGSAGHLGSVVILRR